MTELFRDTLSFAGAVIIRRILGIAHVIDLESIKDPDTRSSLSGHACLFSARLPLQN